MAEPFRLRSDQRAGLAALASRKRAFLVDLENELAGAERILEVDATRLQKLADEREVDLARDVATPRRRLYRRFLEYCLVDHALSQDELADLSHLQTLLRLESADVGVIHDDATRSIYGRAIDEVLTDYRLDPEEEEFLKRLRQDIRISKQTADELEREGAERARHRFVQKAVVPKSSFVASQGAELELEGSSESSFQEAVEAAVAAAAPTVATIESAELKSLRVEVADGSIRRWSVKLTSRL